MLLSRRMRHDQHPRLALTAAVTAVLVAMGLFAAPAATAGTTTEEITVPATIQYLHGQNPSDPGNCSALVFVQWADVPGTVSARAYYTFKGQERSESATPPFSDTTNWVATYTVSPGSHWILVGKSWADGPLVNTCEDKAELYKTLITNPVRVVLTVERDNSKCEAAQTLVTKLQGKVKSLKSRMKAASGKRKDALRDALRTRKKQLAKAKVAEQRAC